MPEAIPQQILEETDTPVTKRPNIDTAFAVVMDALNLLYEVDAGVGCNSRIDARSGVIEPLSWAVRAVEDPPADQARRSPLVR